MKIDTSTIEMNSKRHYTSYEQLDVRTTTVDITGRPSHLLTGDQQDLFDQLNDTREELQAQKKNQAAQKNQTNQNKTNSADETQGSTKKISTLAELRIAIMEKILEMFSGADENKSGSDSLLSMMRNGNSGGTQWEETTVMSSFYSEQEMTAYTAEGIVKTTDGRELSFQVTAEMSRSFVESNMSLVSRSYYTTDPLVINMDSNIASVTDQKFLFDLDCDGEEESMSFTGGGSGFLALDKNGDGVINDGSELFGTQSGDGFRDLAVYDEDGNGWIDESDRVFGQLKVWIKDENGNNQLLSLKDANVGAIYLGRVNTQFSLNQESTNETNAIIKNTGIYLKETGEAGTIQHVDFAV